MVASAADRGADDSVDGERDSASIAGIPWYAHPVAAAPRSGDPLTRTDGPSRGAHPGCSFGQPFLELLHMQPSRAALFVPLFVLAHAAPSRAQTSPGARWLTTGSALQDFEIAVDSTVAQGGRWSLRISAAHEPSGFASLVTMVPAAAYVGRRIRVSAMLRTAALGGQGATLWVRADSAGKSVAFSTTQGQRLLSGTTGWRPVSVELDVPSYAAVLSVGALSAGSGRLWVDEVRLEPLRGDTVETAGVRLLGFEPPDTLIAPTATASATTLVRSPFEAPRPLTARGLDNLAAFARLVGYVRFWHPGDSVLATNWDEFTVRGMRVVERAPSADSLATSLRTLFAAVAPTVAVYRTGARPPAPPRAPATGQEMSVVFWEHCGYGVPTGTAGARQTAYHSTRRRVAAPDGRIPTEVPVTDCGPARAMPVSDPAQPFVADLGGGVSASVPLALFTGAAATETSWHPQPPTERFSVEDRATRLADVALLWMVPQHFYPYFDVVHTDWQGALRHALGEAAVDSGAVTFDATLDRLVAALRDGHGSVIRQNSVQATPDVTLGWVENRAVVTAVGDSAAAAGVRVGDELLASDGRPVADALRDAEARTSGATPQWVRLVALYRVTLGVPGSISVLRLRDPITPGAAPRDVKLARRAVPPPTESRPAKVAELRPGVLYVDLGRITDDDFAQALPRLVAARGIVFDMRGYPGRVSTPAILAHLADSTIHSPLFELPLVQRPDHAEMRFVDVGWAIAPRQPRLRAKVAFLTGAGAISYAESTMGVVEENHLASIVGEPTAGTNGDINPFALPGGYTVVWTGLRVRKRDGTPHHGVGIHPSIPVSPTLRGVRAGRDEVLERALEVVSKVP